MLESIKTKICTKCRVEKSVEMFSKYKASKDGFKSQCKDCAKAYKQANAEKISVAGKAYREANREANRANREANREAIALKVKAYQQANAEVIKEYQKEYYQGNREKFLSQQKAYRQTPIGKAVHKNASNKRRSLTKQGDVTNQQLLELQQSAKTCYWCGVSLKGKIPHIDHYIPLSKGGEHTISNLVVSCSKCNLTKNAKDPLVFAHSIGKLF